MDFRLTNEQVLFRNMAREFSEKNIRPLAKEIDRSEKIPLSLLKGMADLGLLGVTIPENYGGPGGNAVLAAVGAMEVARGDVRMALPVYYLLAAGWSSVISKYGTEEAKGEILPRIAKAEHFVGIATTELGGGSDLANRRTTAVRKGDKFIINGEKAFYSGYRECEQLGRGGHVTLLRTDLSKGTRGFSFMYVPYNRPGMKYTNYSHLGRTGFSTGGMTYENVEVPAKYLLGEENRGYNYAMDGFSLARTLVASACIGAAERALELGMDYIKTREAFGKPIARFEGIQFELANDYAMLEMVRTAVLKAAWLYDEVQRGGDATISELNIQMAISKLMAPQVAFDIFKHVMMWYGGAGYNNDVELGMGLKGILSYLAGAEGALNIMRIIIGKELLGKEFMPTS